MNFFRDFESDMKIKQKSLVEELASEAVNEKANQQSQVREERRREAGYVRMWIDEWSWPVKRGKNIKKDLRDQVDPNDTIATTLATRNSP